MFQFRKNFDEESLENQKSIITSVFLDAIGFSVFSIIILLGLAAVFYLMYFSTLFPGEQLSYVYIPVLCFYCYRLLEWTFIIQLNINTGKFNLYNKVVYTSISQKVAKKFPFVESFYYKLLLWYLFIWVFPLYF